MSAFAELIQAATVEAKPKSKKASAMPVVEPTDQLAEWADTYQEAKINMKQAEAVMAQAYEHLEGAARERQDRDGYAGKFANSYLIQGVRHTVKVVYQNRFSINPQDRGELKEILGDEYSRLIAEKPTVKLKAEVLECKALQDELKALIGDRFLDFFETTWEFAVADGFSKEIYRVVAPDRLADLRLYARQYKPSLR